MSAPVCNVITNSSRTLLESLPKPHETRIWFLYGDFERILGLSIRDELNAGVFLRDGLRDALLPAGTSSEAELLRYGMDRITEVVSNTPETLALVREFAHSRSRTPIHPVEAYLELLQYLISLNRGLRGILKWIESAAVSETSEICTLLRTTASRAIGSRESWIDELSLVAETLEMIHKESRYHSDIPDLIAAAIGKRLGSSLHPDADAAADSHRTNKLVAEALDDMSRVPSPFSPGDVREAILKGALLQSYKWRATH